MPLTRTALVWTLSGVAAAAVLVTGGAVWAMTTQPATNAKGGTAGAANGPSTAVDAPPLYTGDELEWLLLPDEKLTSLLFVTDHRPVAAEYYIGGERAGMHVVPAVCDGLFFNDDVGVIGFREAGWGGDVMGAVQVRQFPSSEQAQAWAALKMDTVPACTTFEAMGDAGDVFNTITLSDPVDVSKDQARVVVFEETYAQFKYNHEYVRATMLQGNIVVTVDAPDSDAHRVDKKALAEALLAQAEAAQKRLRQQLG